MSNRISMFSIDQQNISDTKKVPIYSKKIFENM